MTILRFVATCATLVALATAAQAQQVYRIVGPDGKVTFSDRAPSGGAEAAQAGSGQRGGNANDALPYQLRQVAARFPVTLYTGNDCQPCNSARNLLIGRGVPFSERTITTSEDVEAFKRLSGGTSLPFGTIGAQQLQGFSDAEWTQYLDLAGYPKQSQLPANYRRPAATPLVAVVEKKAPAAEPEARPQPESAPAAPTKTPANPAGIVF
mgnify:CR=1 FL=1